MNLVHIKDESNMEQLTDLKAILHSKEGATTIIVPTDAKFLL